MLKVLTSLVSSVVVHSVCGKAVVGLQTLIRTDGSNGIADSTKDDDVPMMHVRYHDGVKVPG